MSKIKVDKVVSSLPGTLVPNTIYAVRVGTGFDLYFTDSTGSTAHKINQFPYDDSTPPTTGQTIEFNGTNFVPADASGGGSDSNYYVTANKSKTNDATLALDDELVHITEANGVYALTTCVRYRSGTAEDFKYSIMGTNAFGEFAERAFADPSSSAPLGAPISQSGGGSIYDVMLYITAIVTASASAGIVGFGWSQNTSGGNNTTLYKGSWMRVTKLN